MTPEEFATRLERLIERALVGGLTEEAILVGLGEAMADVEKGLMKVRGSGPDR